MVPDYYCFQYPSFPTEWFSLNDLGSLPVDSMVMVPCMCGNPILSVTTMHKNQQLDTHRVVKNISSRSLTDNEEKVLALGLNFALTPRRIPYRDIIATVESTARQLSEEQAKHLKKEVSRTLQYAKPPRDNLNKCMRKAIRNLQKDDSLPADKGNAMVVMDKVEYDRKMLDLLADPTYRKLKKDPTTKLEKKITDALKVLERKGDIITNQRKYLAPQYSSPPQLYGTP